MSKKGEEKRKQEGKRKRNEETNEDEVEEEATEEATEETNETIEEDEDDDDNEDMEEEIEVDEITIDGVLYLVDDMQNGPIYATDETGDFKYEETIKTTSEETTQEKK